jgi:hypothetical protein
MRTFCRSIFILCVLAVNLLVAGITFEVTDLGLDSSGDPLFRYTYVLSGLPLTQFTEVDLRFDPDLYGTLSNPVAPADYDVLVLQPNNPPGVPGDYKPLSLVPNPTQAGLFSVDFTFFGPGPPGSQPFFINQYDPNFMLINSVGPSFTTPANPAVVPEPGTLLLVGAALLIAGLARRFRNRTCQRVA